MEYLKNLILELSKVQIIGEDFRLWESFEFTRAWTFSGLCPTFHETASPIHSYLLTDFIDFKLKHILIFLKYLKGIWRQNNSVLFWFGNATALTLNQITLSSYFKEDMRHIEIRIKNNFNETQIICLRLFHKYILRRMKLFTHTYFFAYALSYLLAYTRYSGPKQFDLVWKLYISLHLPTLVCLGSNGPVGPMYSPASTYYQQ